MYIYIYKYVCVCVRVCVCILFKLTSFIIFLGVERVGLKGVMGEESGDVRPQVLNRDCCHFVQHELVRQSELRSFGRNKMRVRQMLEKKVRSLAQRYILYIYT